MPHCHLAKLSPGLPSASAPHAFAPCYAQPVNHPRRIGLLRRRMSKAGVAGLLVTHLPDLRYLCGFTGSSAALAVTRRHARLFTDGRYTTQAAEETERWIASHPDDLAAQIQLTEFQLARLDRNAAIDRFVSLVGRMIERGESVQAGDLVNRLRRDAPGDHRVGALASRMGRP